MRKINPNDVKSDFVAALEDITQSVEEVKVSLLSDKTMKLVAESSLLSAAVLWEGFVTDLFVAYINRSTTQLSSNLNQRVSESVKAKFGDFVSQVIMVSLPQHLKEREVRAVLDPKDYNISFGSAADMVRRARDYLPANAAAKFNALSAGDLAAIDAWLAMRNFLAHRSRASKARMNEALAESAVPAPLKRSTNRVDSAGSFLKSVPQGTANWRVLHYLDAMKSIANKL